MAPLMKRLFFCCGRKPGGLVTDCTAILILATSLIIIGVYNVPSSFDEHQEKPGAGRAKQHLREIVRLDKRKQQLSVQLDELDVGQFNAAKQREMERARARLAEVQRQNAEIEAKKRELEKEKNKQPPNYYKPSKETAGEAALFPPEIKQANEIHESQVTQFQAKLDSIYHEQSPISNVDVEEIHELGKNEVTTEDHHMSRHSRKHHHESHADRTYNKQHTPQGDDPMEKRFQQVLNDVEESLQKLSQQSALSFTQKNYDAIEIKRKRILEAQQAKRKKYLESVKAARRLNSTHINRDEYILTGPHRMSKKVSPLMQQHPIKSWFAGEKQEEIEEEPVNCSSLEIGQYMAAGDRKIIMLAGFPKSGALWIHSLVETITPYYFFVSTTPEAAIGNDDGSKNEDEMENMPDDVRVLIEEKEALDAMANLDETREGELLKEEITFELSQAAKRLNSNISDSSEIEDKANKLVHMLEEEEAAVEQADDLNSEEKDEIDYKLENAMFTDLVKTSPNETSMADLNATDALFVALANEERTIEELDIDSEAKIEIEKHLEDNVLGTNPSLDELGEAAVETTKNISGLKELSSVFEDYAKEKSRIEEMSLDENVKSDLKHALQKDILEKVVEVHETETPDREIAQVKNRTENVLKKLDEASEFVETMDRLSIGRNHSEIETHLEFNALEDIVEAVEDIKDPEEELAKEEIEIIEEEKMAFENATIENSDSIDRESEELRIGARVVSDALDLLDPGNDLDSMIDTPENKARLIDNLMEKETMLENSQNLTSDETDAIDIELEEAVAVEIMESESKINQAELAMQEVYEEGEDPENNDASETIDISSSPSSAMVTDPDIMDANSYDERESSEIFGSKRRKRDAIDNALDSLQQEIQGKIRRSTTENEETLYGKQYPVMKSVLRAAEDFKQIESIKTEIETAVDTPAAIMEKKALDEQAISKAMEVTRDVIQNPAANPNDVVLAEDLIELNASMERDLAAIQESNLMSKEKLEIEEKVEKEAMSEMVEAIGSMASSGPASGTTDDGSTEELVESYVKENLEAFLEDTDIKRTEIVEDESLEEIEKLEVEEELQKEAESKILQDLDMIKSALSSGEDKATDGTKAKVKEMYAQLTEQKYEIEGANISAVKKADLESKLDETFANEVIEAMKEEEQSPKISTSDEAIELLTQEILHFFNEKLTVNKAEDEDKLYLYTKSRELNEVLGNRTLEYLIEAEKLDNPGFSFSDNVTDVVNSIIGEDLLKETEKIEAAFLQLTQMSGTDDKQFEFLRNDIVTSYILSARTLISNVIFGEDLTQPVEIVNDVPNSQAEPVTVEFTRKYFKDLVMDKDLLETWILVLRSPFENLLAMQLKQANLAASNYKADIFDTKMWNDFATSGIKAWFAHTRGYICGLKEQFAVVHYEEVSANFDDEMRHLMRAMGLPEQYGNTLHCMLEPASKPRAIVQELSYRMKPDFPFNLSLTTLIENYMCRVHKTLMDQTGKGLPLDAYMERLKKVFRDRKRSLPQKFCRRSIHLAESLRCSP